jgi:hypothetical protein
MRLAMNDYDTRSGMWQISVKTSKVAFRAVAQELRRILPLFEKSYENIPPHDELLKVIEQLESEEIQK